MRLQSDQQIEVLLDGEPVESEIRSPEVSSATSKLSVEAEVRERMVELQRRWAKRHGAVVEGRDIGSVVFPDTPHKFFLDADPAVRAGRRHRQLAERDRSKRLQEVAEELAERDARDSGRQVAPLRCDASYQRIDTSKASIDEVVAQMVEHIHRSGGGTATESINASDP